MVKLEGNARVDAKLVRLPVQRGKARGCHWAGGRMEATVSWVVDLSWVVAGKLGMVPHTSH